MVRAGLIGDRLGKGLRAPRNPEKASSRSQDLGLERWSLQGIVFPASGVCLGRPTSGPWIGSSTDIYGRCKQTGMNRSQYAIESIGNVLRVESKRTSVLEDADAE